jgi:uncharacterized membrane protein
VVLLLGFGVIMLTIDSEATTNLLFVAGPIIIGGLLLTSGFIQRIIMGYRVSLLTWITGIITAGFGTMQLIRLTTDINLSLQTQILYALGLMIIFSGLVIIINGIMRPRA